jgi:hypothetical protein
MVPEEVDVPETERHRIMAVHIAEVVARRHYLLATSEDNSLAGSWTSTYQNSQALLKAAIKAAYPHVDPEGVYNVWANILEDIASCVKAWWQDVIDVDKHAQAGHQLEDLPYDPDYGDNQWRCLTCNITVVVPGWR